MKEHASQILSSKLTGSNWSRPQVLSFEMPGASYAHPSLSADGNTLYFSSDVGGSGYGGMDIYMVHRNGDAWETPVNLGPTVNTSGNELFPFIAGDSSLYFTSDGQPGFGGLDLFHAKLKDGKLDKAENMGVDFNSAKDDLSLIVDSRNRTGYFASNRAGDDDIYSFKLPAKRSEIAKDKEKMAAENQKTGTVTDKATGARLPGARIEISRPSNPYAGTYYYTNDSGIFNFSRKIDSDDMVKVIKDKYRVDSFYGAKITDTKAFTIGLDSEMIISTTRRSFTTLYYDVNKSNLTASTLEMLRPVIDMMKSSPNNLVYVSGYADERGGDTYNFGLSLRRVREVVDFLSSQGVDMLKIRSAFFGAVKLSAKCRKNPKCVVDTDRENRRVEIYISNE